MEQSWIERVMLASDALVERSLQKSQFGETGICVKYDGGPIHETVLAWLYHECLVGVRTFGGEVYDDTVASPVWGLTAVTRTQR